MNERRDRIRSARRPGSLLLAPLLLAALACSEDETRHEGPFADPTLTSSGGSSQQGSAGSSAAAPTGAAPVPAAPTQATAPLSVELPTGRAYRVDTTTRDVAGVVRGNSGVQLNAHLADDVGHRALSLRASDGKTVDVAPSGWSILPVASADEQGKVLVCWSQLRGESLDGEVPHPSGGMQLLCRYGSFDALGETFDAGHDRAPTWLSDVTGDSTSGFEVTYIRTGSGWLIGPAQEGDGIFVRSFDGVTLGEPRRLFPE